MLDGHELPGRALERSARSEPELRPVVVQYLYIHGGDESFEYPSSRDRSGDPARLALRYLECVLVQAASLRLQDADCELVLVTNRAPGAGLSRRGARMLGEIEAMGTTIVEAEYRHRPAGKDGYFAASRYVFDAIEALATGAAPDRPMWLMDVDCVWVDPARAFGLMPPRPAIACVTIPYPPDWANGPKPARTAQLAQQLGAPPGPVPVWVGGELLAGHMADLLELVRACERLESELTEHGVELRTEEQFLSLALALGRIDLVDVTSAVRRIWTGPRHGAPRPEHPGSLALWHLPSEKGLAFRRAARELAHGRGERLRRDLADSARALRRFNVEGAGFQRRVRDDLWLLRQRGRDAIRARL
jgi:hypothetical protein